MPFYLPKKGRIGPFVLNFSKRGVVPKFTSLALKFGRYTYNVTHRQHTVDTPGPGYWQSKRGKRKGQR